MVIPGFRLGGVAAAAFAVSLSLSSSAPAETRGVDLRVVSTQGRTLAEFRQYTGAVTIDTDPRAECFGEGTGGSGDRVRIANPTALGAVREALPSAPDLRPLSITDAFADQGFGLGVCGIGGQVARGSAYWYVKRNHVGAQVSGSQLKVRQGDDVLRYRTPGYPPPRELALQAPARARPQMPFGVTVYSYGDGGSRRPAVGASVTGASAPTDSAGHAMVSLAAGARSLGASDPPTIPSNRVDVCVAADQSACPSAHGKRIFGSNAADVIVGTRGWDSIWARGGADRIDLREGGRDRVGCGRGRDRVILARGDQDDHVAADCEQVERR
jgi:hypothetical protein